MSDSDSDECHDKFADVVVDVSTILAPPNVTPTPSLKKNTNQQLTNDHRELLSRHLYDALESSLKIKKTRSPNHASIELQEDDVTLFKPIHNQETKANSSQTLKESIKNPSKKRKASSSESDDDDSENMEKFHMAAMTGEMLSSARFALNSGHQLTNSDSLNSNTATGLGRTERNLNTVQCQSIKEG